MNFAKKYWTYILAQAEGMPVATKLLIGSLVVIMLLVGFIAVLYAGKPEVVPIGQFATARSEEVVARLDASGIKTEIRNGQIYVPVAQRVDAVALLAREDMLSDNASMAFAEVAGGNVWETDAQGRRKYLIATQDYLNKVARKFKGVRSAEVVISLPERTTFGRSVRPSASVTVTMAGSNGVDQHLVASLAGLVSGAVAELRPQDVVILDANRGRQHTVADPDDVIPTEVLELVSQQEDRHRRKIENTLANIPGVIVAVKVTTNPIRREVIEEIKYSETEPLKSQEDTEMSSKDYRHAGEAATRPNTTMTIDGGDTLARETSETTSRVEFGEKQRTSTAQIEKSGHQIEQINVTVNVPRSYFVSIFKAANPDNEDAPSDADLESIKTAQLEMIEKQVQPLIMAKAPGEVVANMVYDQAYLEPVAAGVGGGGAVDGILGTVTSTGGGAMVLASVLGCVSLLLAFMMVKRATKPQELPSLQELAGVPPTLPTDDELIGEAEEVESTMAGLELDEDEMRTRNLAEQISEMIKSNPQDAGGLLGKWVQADD